MTLTHGGLFEGYGGTTMAAEAVLGSLDTRWVSDIKPASIALLAHRAPDVPNLDDMTQIDCAAAPRVDVLTASWPCFAGDTVVLTARGGIPIRDVQVGELVLTHRNRWRRVLHTGSRTSPTRQVRAQGAPPLVTTDDHPFYVRTHRICTNGTTRETVDQWSNPQWRPAADIEGWRTAVPARIEALPAPAWPLTPWLAGRWVADGWAEPLVRRIRFAVGDDKVEKFRAELTRAGLVASESAGPGCVRFTISNTDAAAWLVEHFGHGAAGKRLPGWLYASEDRAEWLDGYLSGDGHEDAGASWAVSVSRPLAVGVAVLGATLGLAPQVKVTTPPVRRELLGRDVGQRPWYRIGLRRQVARQYVRWADGHAWGVVRSSSPTGRVEQVWNLHVEDDNSYVADGLVVHNCQPHSSAGKRLGEADPRALWPHVARAIAQLRPPIFLGENVARIAGNGELRRVVRSLADLGYVGAWRVLSAADVGGCHLRKRCWVAAVDPAADAAGLVRSEGWTVATSNAGRAEPGHGDPGPLTLLPTPGARLSDGRGSPSPATAQARMASGRRNLDDAVALLPTPSTRNSNGVDRRGPRETSQGYDLQTVAALLPTPAVADARNTRNATAGRGPGQEHHHSGWTLSDVAHADRWGRYAEAIARWERALGRPAPDPTVPNTKGNPALSPRFAEWMMGLPTGWVDVPGISRSGQLSLLGDGVVPQQGGVAFRFLLDHLAERLAAERAA